MTDKTDLQALIDDLDGALDAWRDDIPTAAYFRLNERIQLVREAFRQTAPTLPGAGGGDDTARLDWLDSQRNDDVAVGEYGQQSLVACYWNVGGQCYDVRTAIDRCMEAAALPPQQGG
jgi:hypothetical protein